MAIEGFDPILDPDAVDWNRIEQVTVVCLVEDPSASDGVLVVLYESPHGWGVPSGARIDDEDVWDSSVLRIPMETMSFRRQDTHPYLLGDDGRHVVFWVTGGAYAGTRMRGADVPWWTGSVTSAAELLTSQGDGALAALVAAADDSRRTMSYERRAADVHRTLVGAYLSASTPQGASGFGGTDEEWREARGTLADALDGLSPSPRRETADVADLRSGASGISSAVSPIRFLDHACANGHLAVSMVAWGAERGVTVDPYGVDIAPELVERARSDHPDLASHFWVGDALTWVHPAGERFDLVHVLLDVVPASRHPELIQHQLDHVVAPGGRLLLSEYGDPPSSRSAEAQVIRAGFTVAGRTRQPTRGGRQRGCPSVWVEAAAPRPPSPQ